MMMTMMMIVTCSAIPCTTFRSLSTSLQVQLLSLFVSLLLYFSLLSYFVSFFLFVVDIFWVFFVASFLFVVVIVEVIVKLTVCTSPPSGCVDFFQPAQAVTSNWQLRTTSPMNTNSSVGENCFLAKNGSWPGRL